uniref:C2 NT-type domain-containing protein n=1 Tax=Bionectria ochroleuca TaxID=29856 RepID=A0A8H7TU60_BIOOC
MDSLIGKARKPKFELHLKIYDLNNVPLVSGNSYIKWHLTHSIHAEHRGRTDKCPITNHRVDYALSKVVSHIRISVDKTNTLTECPIEFEVVQEFAITEKITLGTVKLNLSEYVEESEVLAKDSVTSPGRRRASSAGVSPGTVPPGTKGVKGIEKDREVHDGVIRRYLMQESKINSTLKIGILMVQVDGERSFLAPPLKNAPAFGGIAGIVAGEQVEDDASPILSISKPRDATDLHDLYRRTLAASWHRLPSELAADECIEDIFSGGNGWKTKNDGGSTSDTEEDEYAGGTLRPADIRRLDQTHLHHPRDGGHILHRLHRRTHSGSSDQSSSTITGRNPRRQFPLGRDDGREVALDLSRSGSLASLAPTLDSERSRIEITKPTREISEDEVRDDMIAWRLPGGGLAF